MELKLTLSQDDLDSIGHMVVDPAAWAQHAFEHVGAAAVRAKVDKYRDEFLSAKERFGSDYRNAAKRDADMRAGRKAKREEEERQFQLKVIADRKARIERERIEREIATERARAARAQEIQDTVERILAERESKRLTEASSKA